MRMCVGNATVIGTEIEIGERSSNSARFRFALMPFENRRIHTPFAMHVRLGTVALVGNYLRRRETLNSKADRSGIGSVKSIPIGHLDFRFEDAIDSDLAS